LVQNQMQVEVLLTRRKIWECLFSKV
jgi:hypothetical protein